MDLEKLSGTDEVGNRRGTRAPDAYLGEGCEARTRPRPAAARYGHGHHHGTPVRTRTKGRGNPRLSDPGPRATATRVPHGLNWTGMERRHLAVLGLVRSLRGPLPSLAAQPGRSSGSQLASSLGRRGISSDRTQRAGQRIRRSAGVVGISSRDEAAGGRKWRACGAWASSFFSRVLCILSYGARPDVGGGIRRVSGGAIAGSSSRKAEWNGALCAGAWRGRGREARAHPVRTRISGPDLDG